MNTDLYAVPLSIHSEFLVVELGKPLKKEANFVFACTPQSILAGGTPEMVVTEFPY